MTIYVELLDEGVEVWRPVEGEAIESGLYRLPSEPPADEVWAFPPGSIVRCERRGDDLYAVEVVDS